MTLTLEISPEVEAELTRAATSAGRALPVWIVEAARTVAEQNRRDKDEAEARRIQAVNDGFGKFAGLGRTVDEFLADRHAEGEAEYDKWIARQNARGAGKDGESA